MIRASVPQPCGCQYTGTGAANTGISVATGHSHMKTQYSLRPIKKAPPRTLLRTYSGILPKRHGILVKLNETDIDV